MASLGLPRLAQAQAAADTVDLRRVTLRVGDQTGATQGLLRAAGLLNGIPYKVEWSTYAAAVNLHEALKADATDIGASNDSPLVNAIAGGSRIVTVAAWRNGGKDTSLLVPKSSKIQSLADLRGKTISPTTRGSVGHYLAVGVLKEGGLRLDEARLAFLAPADASAAFNSGSIDAWAIWGIYRARAIGALGARVLHDGHGINSGLLVLSATQASVRDPQKVAAMAHFANLTDKAYEWARSNQEQYVSWFAEFSKQERAVSASMYEQNVGYRRVALDNRFVERLQQTHGTWVEAGLLSGSIDFNKHVYRELPLA
jgi:sulfonate transport system substrate-binding protein